MTTTDFTAGDITTLNASIRSIDVGGTNAAANTAYTITLTDNIYLKDSGGRITDLLAINLSSGSTLRIVGNNHTLDGGSSTRGLFAYSGTIGIEDLTIANTIAKGGNGGAGGGGGAGLGGGLFVANDAAHGATAADVTLKNVDFSFDSAKGGNGGGVFGLGSGFWKQSGGGGGLGGDGGDPTLGPFGVAGGGGGGGIYGAGGTQGASGASGTIPGSAGGGAGAVGGAGGAGGGGGGAGGSNAFNGGNGGGGGGIGGGAGADWGGGGNGGFGGGGAGSVGLADGAAGGFGGGGGGGGGTESVPGHPGGKGGFGGGGGGAGFFNNVGGGSVFGGGGGGPGHENGGGGGGLGAGGAIFVQDGASLRISGGSLADGSVTAGRGASGGGDGQAYGSGIFIQGHQVIWLEAGVPDLLTVSDVIADLKGSGGPSDASGGLAIAGGTGVVRLGATNTYTGGTTIWGGTLELQVSGAAGSGAIDFAGPGTLRIDGTTMPSNTISHFGLNDRIDLADIPFFAGATANYDASSQKLTVISNGVTKELHLTAPEVPTFAIPFEDASGGIALVLTANAPPTPAGDTTTAVSGGSTSASAPGVLANDTDPYNRTLSVSAVAHAAANVGSSVAGSYGHLTLKSDGSYIYSADRSGALDAAATGSHPIDVFSYTVDDGHGNTADATLSISVDRLPSIPVSGRDIDERAAIAVSADHGVFANDYVGGSPNFTALDQDGDALTVSTVAGSAANVGTLTATTYGHIRLNADGSYSYAADRTAAIDSASTVKPIDVITFVTDDGHGGSTQSELHFAIARGPVVTGTHAANILDNASYSPFLGVTISDPNSGATDSVTITLSGGGGTLTGPGLGGGAAGIYTLSAASPDTIATELRGLTFTPDAGAPNSAVATTLTLVVSSSAGVGVTDSATTVENINSTLTPLIATERGPIATVAQLNDVISQANHLAAGSGAYVIFLASGADIELTSAVTAIDLHSGVTLEIEGQGAALDGLNESTGASYNQRGLFVYSGTIAIENLTIKNTIARGGNGGIAAGGGAGLGGGLFVANDEAHGAAPANVTLNNVAFDRDAAFGGNGGAGTNQNFAGGGGGLGGDGGGGFIVNGAHATAGGGGGIGGSGGGISREPGTPGIVAGAAGGGAAAGPAGAGGGGADGGGGGASPSLFDGAGGGGGVGGGSASLNALALAYVGGSGGFGGGGGGSAQVAGNGGFGGGGGAGDDAGAGGFGGGGGGPWIGNGAGGGFGAGKGGNAGGHDIGYGLQGFSGGGGGGLGAGGGIFVQEGSQLTIKGGSLSGGTVRLGTGGGGFGFGLPSDPNSGSGDDGHAYGSGLFIHGNQTITLAPEGAQTLIISDVIADMTGSGDPSGQAGVGKLTVGGSGRVVLAGDNKYTGDTTISGGTLELANVHGAGSGSIVFQSGSRGTLQIDGAAMPDNAIDAFDRGDFIDLRGLAFAAGATAAYDAGTHVLTVTSNGISEQLTLVDPTDTGFSAVSDRAAGTPGTRVFIGSPVPTIQELDGDTVRYIEGGGVLLDSGTAARAIDADATDFNGGNLTVAITAGGTAAEDVLGIRTGAVTLSQGTAVGSTVSVGGVAIGTIAANGDGAGGHDLIVAFNGNATPANVTTLVQALTYANSNQDSASALPRTVAVTIDDGDGHTSTPANLTVNVVTTPNEAPVNTVPGPQTIDEDTDLAIGGLAVRDGDAGDGALTMTLSVMHGTVTVGSAVGAAESGSGTASVTLTGTLAALNAVFSASGNIVYKGAPDFNGDDTLTVVTDDGGNVGRGGAKHDTDTVAIVVNPVNDAPVNILPAAQSVDEDTSLAIAGLAVRDADAGGGTLTTTLSVHNGTLTVASAGGAAVSGSGTDSVTLTGTLAQINTTLSALDNVLYKGLANYGGQDTLTVVTDDGGNTGGHALATTDTLAIYVNPVVDAPVITTGTPVDAAENDTFVTYVDADAPDGLSGVAITGGPDSALFDIVDFDRLVFRTAPDYERDPHTYQVEVTVWLGPQSDTKTITVDLIDVNDNAPAFVSDASAPLIVPENVAPTKTVYTASATDADATAPNNTIEYSLSGDDAALFAIDPRSGAISFRAAPDFEAPRDQNHDNNYQVTVEANDSEHYVTQDVMISVANINEAPVAQDQALSGERSISGRVQATDVDSPSLSYSVMAGPQHGALTLEADGRFSYAADAGHSGPDSFTFKANDGALDSNIATVTLDLTPHLTGTPGDDTFTAVAGNARYDAGAGIDTINFDFKLTDATVTYIGNEVIIDGPTSHTVLTGFERYAFSDGTVDNNDGDVLVDDLFYYSRNHDVWNAHADADQHYHQSGWHEWRDPNAFFDTSFYLGINADVRAAGVDPLVHFDQSGWQEGRQPSMAFDAAAYLAANPDVAAAQVDPLAHFLSRGAAEGRQPIALGSLLAADGFDYVYYLQNNPDVAAAHVDPLQHFETVGWKEGRNPNALFDVKGYLAAYTDVAAAGVNPLDHYHQSGWLEGRDPSPNFDTADYLGHYADVAAAHVDPLLHFLQTGIHEGRSAFADGVWG